VFAAGLLLTVIGWFAVSVALAFLIGGAIRLADARQARISRYLRRVP
jgi:hypothetical protein